MVFVPQGSDEEGWCFRFHPRWDLCPHECSQSSARKVREGTALLCNCTLWVNSNLDSLYYATQHSKSYKAYFD
uniref:CAI-3 n=1 Tax=Schistosoma japonicum TaxID=6182 RepID=Q8MQK9_SCHJA|nr:CAI-3 [Schistosoma japonicum]